MKKIVILWIMFFTIFSHTFADENLIEFRNIGFSWQLFIYHNKNQNIDFIDLNPLFFSNGNKYFSINYLGNISQNNSSQSTQRISANSEVNAFSILGSIILFSGLIYAGSSMNRQEREIYNNTWEQQLQEERMQRNLFNNGILVK
jgi:hypothetical protein